MTGLDSGVPKPSNDVPIHTRFTPPHGTRPTQNDGEFPPSVRAPQSPQLSMHICVSVNRTQSWNGATGGVTNPCAIQTSYVLPFTREVDTPCAVRGPASMSPQTHGGQSDVRNNSFRFHQKLLSKVVFEYKRIRLLRGAAAVHLESSQIEREGDRRAARVATQRGSTMPTDLFVFDSGPLLSVVTSGTH